LRFTPYIALISFFILFQSCKEKTNQTEDENAGGGKKAALDNSNLETNVQLEIHPTVLDPDSILPPERIKAGEPVFQKAHSNIKSVKQPIIKLLNKNVPKFVVGKDTIKEAVVSQAHGKVDEVRYNEPVLSSNFDFNDGASYNIQGIDVDQGLSSSYIMDIIEDSRGNLWFGTWPDGVTMYNGRTFSEFNEKTGIVSNYIWTIHEHSNGELWFGSDGTGVCKYDGHGFTFYDTEDGLASDLVLDITEDNEGNLWFATGEGISMFDGTEFHTYGVDQGMGGDYVNGIIISKKGDLWFSIDGFGINKFDGKTFTHYTTEEGLISNNVTSIYEDSEENLWIGTMDSGVCMFDGYSFITYQEKMGLNHNHIISILEDSYGNLWFGSDGGGACMFNRFEFKHFSNDQGMSNNIIRSMLEDSDGNIWFGTHGSGANVYNERSFENYTERQGLNDHIIRDILQDQEGYLWFSSNNGVSKYDGNNFWHYTEEQGLGLNTVRAMHQDVEGNFWFATNGNGVSKFDGEYFTNYNITSGMSGDIVLCIHESEVGDLWFGTFLGGVTRYDGYTFSHFTVEEGLGSNTVQAITEDSLGNLYFGTKGAGVDVFDGHNITHYTRKEGLGDDYVVSLITDEAGTVWAGTEGFGINRFTKDTILNFGVDEGLSNGIIWSMVEDNNSDLWLGTEKGLNLFSFRDTMGIEVTTFGKLDGLIGSDFYPGSVCLDDENRIWWGTGKSLAMLDLNKYEQIKKPPILQLTDVRLDQTFLDYRMIKDSIEKGYTCYIPGTEKAINSIDYDGVLPFTNCPERLELPYDINHVTFYFSGIDWSAPHKVQYQFKLQGHDDNWSHIMTENKAVYSNIPPGDYIFKVRAISDSKIWSDVMAYPIIIRRPWWTTWWAFTLYFLAAIVNLVMYIRFRTNKLIENQRTLEAEVNTRTAEVVQQKELVERKNQEITDSITYAQRIQNAILPSQHLIDEYLKEAFIIYQPKDIVAGDFYWLETIDDKILLAAADCTGHGVPGAMVSVVCNNALNRTVREFKLDSPGPILNKVRDLVIKTFETSGEEVKDGMDISLLSIDFKTREIKYSGANNDLYVVSNGKLRIMKADKQPIGEYVAKKEFKEHTIQLKEGDAIYIFTDGYADQFGGPKGKKFKYAQFKQLLLDVQDKTMKDQGNVMVNVIKDWMGTLEQIDDICVIGVKV